MNFACRRRLTLSFNSSSPISIERIASSSLLQIRPELHQLTVLLLLLPLPRCKAFLPNIFLAGK
jgi:hypothetical protein